MTIHGKTVIRMGDDVMAPKVWQAVIERYHKRPALIRWACVVLPAKSAEWHLVKSERQARAEIKAHLRANGITP